MRPGFPRSINNVLPVTVLAHDVIYRCTLANLFGNRLVLPYHPRAATGSIHHVGVRGEDIALSRQPLQGVSIQNQIKGRICAVIPHSDRALVKSTAVWCFSPGSPNGQLHACVCVKEIRFTV